MRELVGLPNWFGTSGSVPHPQGNVETIRGGNEGVVRMMNLCLVMEQNLPFETVDCVGWVVGALKGLPFPFYWVKVSVLILELEEVPLKAI